MNKVILFVALLGITGFALAEPKAVLNVTGTLKRGSCTPTFSNGGVINFGGIPVGNISATELNYLDFIKGQLRIECTELTKVAFQFFDERRSSETGYPVKNIGFTGVDITAANNLFGLGTTPSGVKIGNWALTFGSDEDIQLDGVRATFKRSTDGGATWNETTTHAVYEDGIIVSASISGSAPDAFKTAVFPFRVGATIAPGDTLAITDDVTLDGRATISLTYL